MIEQNKTVVASVQALRSFVDLWVLSHPYMVSLLAETNKAAPLIYESYNAEYALKTRLLQKHPKADMLLEYVKQAERTACLTSDTVVAVSDDDHALLQALVPEKRLRIVTVENGVEVTHDPIFDAPFEHTRAVFERSKIALFIGSAHFPNIEAVDFIVNTLAPVCDDVCFVIVGSVGESYVSRKLPPNVRCTGVLETMHKHAILRIADVALNPMFSGSGSNLKLAEYFAWRLPVVTTKIGARGYRIAHQKEALICDADAMASQLKRVLYDEVLARSLANEAWRYAKEHLAWSVLAKRFLRVIEETVGDCKTTLQREFEAMKD